MKKLVVVAFIGLVAFSCGSKKEIVVNKTKKRPKKEVVVVKKEPPSSSTPQPVVIPAHTDLNATELYVMTYKDIAMTEMRHSKIPASITLAQGILESGSGKGRLSIEANNHFGIKCHGWTGKKIYHDDDASQECFRKYNSADTSFKDHSEFLTGRGRYANLFKLRPNDYKGWAHGLRSAGYATDRKYPQKLISLIERYGLNKYDDMVLSNASEVDYPTNSLSHKVVKGDTLYSLSKKFNTTVADLKRLNGLKNNDLSLGQILIIKTN